MLTAEQVQYTEVVFLCFLPLISIFHLEMWLQCTFKKVHNVKVKGTLWTFPGKTYLTKGTKGFSKPFEFDDKINLTPNQKSKHEVCL